MLGVLERIRLLSHGVGKVLEVVTKAPGLPVGGWRGELKTKVSDLVLTGVFSSKRLSLRAHLRE